LAACAAATATVITGGIVGTASAAAAIISDRIVSTARAATTIVAGGIIGAARLADMVRSIVGTASLANMAGRIVAAAALANFARRVVSTGTRHSASGSDESCGGNCGHEAGFQDHLHEVSPWEQAVRMWTRRQRECCAFIPQEAHLSWTVSNHRKSIAFLTPDRADPKLQAAHR
jgi:hypothetical protein